MARISVNLLGKKKVAAPFGLDEAFTKLGIKTDDLGALKPGLIKLAVALTGLYVANYVPEYFYQQKVAELDQKITALTQRQEALKTELNAKKEVRNQMTQLNKDEIELQRQLKAVSALQQDRALAFRTLDGLMSAMPKTIWLSTIGYSNRRMTIKGSCWDYFSINDFVKSISESTKYTNVSFQGIQTQAPDQEFPGVPDSVKKIKVFDLEYSVLGAGDST